MPENNLVSQWAMNRPLGELDIVYTVGPGKFNQELRLSLRSLVNFPHRKVWFTGYKPPWLADCEYIEGNEGATKEAKIYNSVLAAARHPEVTDQFVLFNDDFFITAPVTKLPPLYLKRLRDHTYEPIVELLGAGWGQSLRATHELLESLGVKRPLSYELHLPMMFDKTALAEVMGPYVSDRPPQLRSLYGNLARIGGRQHLDVKPVGVAKTREQQRPIIKPFLSTHPTNFEEFAPRLFKMFDKPSPYELAGSQRLIDTFVEENRDELERAKSATAKAVPEFYRRTPTGGE